MLHIYAVLWQVDPYLDVGKLHRHLHENSSSFMHRGKKIVVGGDGLASIAEAVLGLPLSKVRFELLVDYNLLRACATAVHVISVLM